MSGAELFGVAPEGFIEARQDLVKRLRAAGRREEAAGVAKLRRPPATVWALNQVARLQPDVLDAVLDAGRRLHAAMSAALGGDASGVRPARAAERQALAAALAAADRHLAGTGHPATEAARRRIEATLRAAMVDDSVAEALGQGVLDSDHDAPGFGPEGAAPASAFVAGVEDEAAAARQAAALRAGLIDAADRLARRAEELESAARGAETAARETEAVARQARQAAEGAAAEAIEARLRVEELEDAGD